MKGEKSHIVALFPSSQTSRSGGLDVFCRYCIDCENWLYEHKQNECPDTHISPYLSELVA